MQLFSWLLLKHIRWALRRSFRADTVGRPDSCFPYPVFDIIMKIIHGSGRNNSAFEAGDSPVVSTKRTHTVQHTLAVGILSLLLLLFLVGASSPLWVRNEQTRAFLARIFVWFVPSGCIVFGGVIIWTGLSDYFRGSAESHWTVITAILAVVLICTGSNILYEFSVKWRMEQIEIQRLQQRHPSSPWKWSRRWRTNRIEYSDKSEMIFSCLVTAVIISGMAIGYATKKEEILRGFQENRLDSLIIFYLLVIGAIFSLRHSVDAANRWKLFRRSSFIMATFPGTIGGTVEGEIQTRSRHVPCNGFDLKLSCMEIDISFRSSFHNIREQVLWESKKTVRIEEIRMGPDGIAFPVSFIIPDSTEESDTSSRNRRIHWVLTADGIGRDCFYTASFRIPVFRNSGINAADAIPRGDR